MSKLTPDLIGGRFPTPRSGTPTRETELAEDQSHAWRRTFLEETHRRGHELWVFGYGSLLWPGEISASVSKRAIVHGWHRRFCLLQWAWRGDIENPCLMLALDRGGRCNGVVFKVGGTRASETLDSIWEREMSGDGYRPRWVKARTEDGTVTALTFVINRAGERYSGRLSDHDIAQRIATACGETGACAEYLRRTVRTLETLGLRDHHLAQLEKLVAKELGVEP